MANNNYVEKWKRTEIFNLMVNLKVLEKQEDKFRLSRWEEINLWGKTSMKWRLKEQYKGFLQERVGSLKKNNQANGNERKREDPNE